MKNGKNLAMTGVSFVGSHVSRVRSERDLALCELCRIERQTGPRDESAITFSRIEFKFGLARIRNKFSTVELR